MIIAVAQLFTRHAGWETSQRALRSLDQVGAGVRPGGRLIQLDKNGPPQLRLDNSRIHVTADEWSIVPAVIGGKMLSRIVECLRNGEPMDQNVYEGASWSSLLPLTARSIAQGGMPVEFPDFTRGDWKTTMPLAVVS